MTKQIKVKQFNKEILKELSNIKPKAYNRAIERFPNIEDWIKGKDYPTYNEISELSKIFKIPIGCFFSKIPEYQPPISIPQDENLIDIVRIAEKMQRWAKDILIEFGYEKIDFSKVKINKSIRLQDLIDEIEEIGIFVLMFDLGEYGGFVLYDDVSPVIVVNSVNTDEGSVDTLIDAVKYIIDKKSGMIDREVDRSVNNYKIYISKKFFQLIDIAITDRIITQKDTIRLTDKLN